MNFQNKLKNFAIKFRRRDIGTFIKISDDNIIIDDKELVGDIKRQLINDR